MKKFTLLFVWSFITMMPMMADLTCPYTDSIFPGQYPGRTAQHVEATIPVGTIVDNITADLVAYESLDSAIILPYRSQPSKLFALQTGTTAITYSERVEMGEDVDPCITNHSILYKVVKGNPVAGFMYGGKVITEYNYDMGDREEDILATFITPTVGYQNGVPFKLNKKVPVSEMQFTSTNPDVAVVNVSGYLTILGGGTTVITASWAGDANWNAAQASITVNVEANPIRLRVAGVKVTKDNYQDILGDGKRQAVYDPDDNLLTLKEVNWDFSDRTIDAKYGVIEYWGEDDLYLVIDGKCTFTNTAMGINLVSHNTYDDTYDADLDITGINNGSLTMSGDEVQIKCAQNLYLDDLQLMVSTKGYRREAMECFTLHVFEGSNVVVSSENEGVAIDTKYLHLEEDAGLDLGAGLAFVSYSQSPTKYGFYNTTTQEKALTVSILSQKVTSYGDPETPDSDKATDIGLSGTSTPGKEDIASIVLGAKDKYNSEAEQLEIYSVLSEDVVKSAIETFGPASEALKAVLPGSISFFVPAGKGSIEIEFVTKNGYVHVQLENSDAVALTNSVMNWVSVPYDVEKDTYVVIYLAPSVIQPVPAHVAAAKRDDEPAMSAFIKGLKVDPTKVPTGISALREESNGESRKMLENGQLLILRGDRVYTVMGQEVK